MYSKKLYFRLEYSIRYEFHKNVTIQHFIKVKILNGVPIEKEMTFSKSDNTGCSGERLAVRAQITSESLLKGQ